MLGRSAYDGCKIRYTRLAPHIFTLHTRARAHIHTHIHETTVQETLYSSSRFRGLLDTRSRLARPRPFDIFTRLGVVPGPLVTLRPSLRSLVRVQNGNGRRRDAVCYNLLRRCAWRRVVVVVPLVFALAVSLAHARARSRGPSRISFFLSFFFPFHHRARRAPSSCCYNEGWLGGLGRARRVAFLRSPARLTICSVFISNADGSNDRRCNASSFVCCSFRESIVSGRIFGGVL